MDTGKDFKLDSQSRPDEKNIGINTCNYFMMRIP